MMPPGSQAAEETQAALAGWQLPMLAVMSG